MKRNLIDLILPVESSRSVECVGRGRDPAREELTSRLLTLGERRRLAVHAHLEIKEVVGSETEHGLGRADLGGGLRFVFEDDGGDVDGVGVKFGRRRDRIEAGLEAGDVRDDAVEWD